MVISPIRNGDIYMYIYDITYEQCHPLFVSEKTEFNVNNPYTIYYQPMTKY